MRFNAHHLVIAVAVVASACGKPPPIHVHEQSAEFQQVVTVDDKIDILFVIDDSLSMENKQVLLANAFEQFIKKFSARGLDFQVGVIAAETKVGFLDNKDLTDDDKKLGARFTTEAEQAAYWKGEDLKIFRLKSTEERRGKRTIDVLDLMEKSETSPYKNFVNQGPGSLMAYKNPANGVTNPRILNRNTADIVDRFKENVKLGGISYNPETPLAAIIEAFSNKSLMGEGGWNKALLRPDAGLAVFILSDEDESLAVRPHGLGQSPFLLSADATERETFIQKFVNLMQSLKPNRPDRVHFAVVVNKSQDSIDRTKEVIKKAKEESVKNGGSADDITVTPGVVGTVLLDVADRLGGLKLDIAQDDFSEPLTQFGDRIVNGLDEFPLNQVVEGRTLRITVQDEDGDHKLVQDDENGFKVFPDPDRPNLADPTHPKHFKVKLLGTAVPKTPKAKIIMKWLPKEAVN